jgi:hypothetical protein
MNDQLLRFGGGGDTSVTLLAIVLVALASIMIMSVQRKYMIVPFLISAFFIPLAQQVVIGGFHFMMFRILMIVAWLRVISSGGFSGSGSRKFQLNRIDKAVILWALVGTVTFIVLWGEWGAVIQRLGFLYNTFGLYFLFRFLVQTDEDISRVVKTLVAVCAILAVCMLNEKITGTNLFSVFGGVPEQTYVREGKLRAQGAFAHPILAGTFGATLLPLFVGLWWRRQSRRVASIGIAASTIVTLCSASSTPLMAYFAGIVALCFWPFRKNMRLFRWATCFVLIGLHLVMKAPVWALIGRVDLVGGSSSSHRYELIDQAIRHFDEWWLVGTRTVSSWGFEMGDTSNHYVETAVTGGVFTLALFIVILIYCFKELGRTRKYVAGDRVVERGVWSLGAALFSNIVAYFGITYFDQTIIAWYALLAIIGAATVRSIRPSSKHLDTGSVFTNDSLPVGSLSELV